jgi:MoaA/NifB/PqqE/SkfB family radical SAM enzyme
MGSWEKAIRGAFNIYNYGLPLAIAHVLMKPNSNYIEEMVELAYSLGAAKFVCDHFLATGRAYDNKGHLELNIKEISQAYTTLEKKQKEYQDKMLIRIGIDPAFYLRIRMLEPSQVLLVRPNGDVKIDCVMPFVLGNIQETSILDIWDQKGKHIWKYRAIRQFINQTRWGENLNSVTPIPYVDNDIAI